MNPTLITAAALLVAFAGCTGPEPVQIVPPDSTPGLEVTAIGAADTNYSASTVDSSAVLPADNQRFAAFLTITSLTFDAGSEVRSGAFSRVLFEDRLRPVRFLARRYGFYGLDLGAVTLNTQPMVRIPHRVRINRPLVDTAVVAGVEYLADLSASYTPGQTYTWSAAAPDSIDPFTLAIRAPGPISVQAPAGGSRITVDRALPLRWTGSGPINIIVGGYEPLRRRVQPLILLRPRVNTGSALLPARVLQLLPRDRFRFFAFSFVLSTRDERQVVGRFPDAVLVQAAAVATTVVELQ